VFLFFQHGGSRMPALDGCASGKVSGPPEYD
jgi:hypothetical protein